MSYRSLALAVATLASMHVASADAQSVYVAPGGVYVAGGPVYVIPAPNNGVAPYVAPTNGYGYGPPAIVAPAPPVVAPTTFYGQNGGYYGAPILAYEPELPPRPPLAVPYYRNGSCVAYRAHGRCYYNNGW